MISPCLALAGTSSSRPHSGQRNPTLRNSQGPLEFASVEAHNDLAVHQDDGGPALAGLFDDLFPGLGILGNIDVGVGNPFRRKKLFRRIAPRSARGRVDGDLLLDHQRPSFPPESSSREPKISRAASKASRRERTTPEGCPFPRRQASRWSLLQKKLLLGQREWATGQ